MLNDKVSRITFLISLSIHLLFLGMSGFNLISFQDIKKTQDLTVQIHLLEIEKPPLLPKLPKIDVMGEEKKLKEIAKEELGGGERVGDNQNIPYRGESEGEGLFSEEVMIEKPKPQPPKEIVIENKIPMITFSPDFVKMVKQRFVKMIKQRIEDVKRYPLVAKRQGIEGVVYLNFIILSDGLTQDVKIIHSSDSKILDDEAVATIKRANLFPPIPKEISASHVEMEVSIIFR
jgi:TonB family protein